MASLVADVKGIQVFIPLPSPASPKEGGDMAGMVGKTVQLKITEVNRARRRVIGSIRAVAPRLARLRRRRSGPRSKWARSTHGTVKSPDFLRRVRGHRRYGRMVHVSEPS